MIHQESLKKRLAKLAAPIFIETLLIMMLGAVDTIMLSRHSDSSVAAHTFRVVYTPLEVPAGCLKCNCFFIIRVWNILISD